MTRAQTLKRDNLLVEFVKKHKGKDNCVSSKEIAEYLQENGYSLKSCSVNMVVRKLIFERCLPICSKNSKGYYWGMNRRDIETTISHLKSRIDELQNHIDILQNFIIS